MPGSELSLHVTDAYRAELRALQDAAAAVVRIGWRRLQAAELEATYESWLTTVASAVTATQLRAVALSGGYLSAFLTSELGRAADAPSVAPQEPYAGISRDGRAVRDAYRSPLIAVLARLKRGEPLDRALAVGQRRALFMVGLDIDHAAQGSLFDGMAGDDRFSGWRRAVRGTCGACLADTRSYARDVGEPMRRHPHCQCIAEPGVRGVLERHRRPSGDEIFAAMAPREQDLAVGPRVAEAIRQGEISLGALLGHSHQETADDFITQAAVLAATDPAPGKDREHNRKEGQGA